MISQRTSKIRVTNTTCNKNARIGWEDSFNMCPVKNAVRIIMLRLKKLLATSKAASKCFGLSNRTRICLSLRDMDFLRMFFSEDVIENKAVSEQDTSADNKMKARISRSANTSPTSSATMFKKI